MEFEVKVEDTSAEALISKISAINKGYFVDPYVHHFVKSSAKKDVIINRGYWSRYEAFRMLISEFLLNSSKVKKNIISLGCGYDTLYFNLKTNPTFKDVDFTYVEMDLSEVVINKLRKISNCKEIKALLNIESVSEKEKSLIAGNYALFEGDLKDPEEIIKFLKTLKIDFDAPTLIFSECVLVYLEGKYTDKLIEVMANNFKILFLLDYEMFNPNDNFGKMMVKNFESKKCPLLGIYDCPTLESLKSRYLKKNFNKVDAYDMLTIYNHYIDKTEKKRIEKIEWFDELEEWNIMQAHYFVSLAMKIDNEKKKEIEKDEGIALLYHEILNKYGFLKK